MQVQLVNVEAELDASRREKNKIKEEVQLQIEELKQKHNDEVTYSSFNESGKT